MHRLANGTQAAALPAANITGTPGYATGGNPATGTVASDLDFDQWNTFQEELCNVATANGATLDPNDRTQVIAAIKALINQATLPTAISAVGSGTIAVPMGATKCVVEMIGPGGAGGASNGTAAGAGGGGGKYIKRAVLSVTGGQIIGYTNSAGGTPDAFGATQTTASPTTFGILSCAAGQNGQGSSSGCAGGIGGQGQTAADPTILSIIEFIGGYGADGIVTDQGGANASPGGKGAASPFGEGGPSRAGGGSISNGVAPGSAGGGAYISGTGGHGAPGFIIYSFLP